MKTKLFILALLPICAFAQPSVKQRATMQSMHDSIVSAHNLFKAPAPQRISLPAAQHSPQAMQWCRDSSYTYTFKSPNDSVLTGKSYSTFDSNGWISKLMEYSWNNHSKQWTNHYKLDYTWNNDVKLTLLTHSTWDTVTNQWVIATKEEFTYDLKGNETMSSYLIPMDTMFSYKAENTYDENSNQISKLIYKWDKNKSQWVYSGKSDNTYDSKNNLILSISYTWNKTTNQWVRDSKYESTYDANGNNTLNISYSWNSTSNQWVVSSYKTVSTYDSNGNKILSISYTWNSNTNQWVNSSKNESTYDSNGKNTLYVYYSWNSTSNQWVNSSKYEYTFDSNGKQTLSIGYSWNSTSNQWVNSSKVDLAFDSQTNIKTWIYYSWDNINNQWVGQYKGEDLCYPNGKRKWTIESYHWDKTNNIWISDRSTIQRLSYDANGNQTISSDYSWNTTSNQWVLNSREYSFYSQHNVNALANIPSTNALKLYPNPVADEVTIDLMAAPTAAGGLYSVDGQVVKTFTLVEGSNSIHLGSLASGTYILRIPTANGMINAKLIKQ